MNQEQLHEKIEFNHVRELIEWAGDVYGEQTAYSFRVNPHEDTVTEISILWVHPSELPSWQCCAA